MRIAFTTSKLAYVLVVTTGDQNWTSMKLARIKCGHLRLLHLYREHLPRGTFEEWNDCMEDESEQNIDDKQRETRRS